jgi:hypothetical protein
MPSLAVACRWRQVPLGQSGTRGAIQLLVNLFNGSGNEETEVVVGKPVGERRRQQVDRIMRGEEEFLLRRRGAEPRSGRGRSQ